MASTKPGPKKNAPKKPAVPQVPIADSPPKIRPKQSGGSGAGSRHQGTGTPRGSKAGGATTAGAPKPVKPTAPSQPGGTKQGGAKPGAGKPGGAKPGARRPGSPKSGGPKHGTPTPGAPRSGEAGKRPANTPGAGPKPSAPPKTPASSATKPAPSTKANSAKLWIKPGFRILAIDAPGDYTTWMGGMPADVVVHTERDGDEYDFVHLFVRSLMMLKKTFLTATKVLKDGAVIWVSYPKKTGSLSTDLTRDVCHEAMLDMGWDATTQVALDDTWSAMRFKRSEAAELSTRGWPLWSEIRGAL